MAARATRGPLPVRTGNAAADQLQLDVWGETLDALHLARAAGMPSDDDAWQLQTALMEHLEGSWQQPDSGMWEIRGRGAQLHALEAHGLGRRRPDDAGGDRPRPPRPRTSVGCAARHDPRRHPRARLRPAAPARSPSRTAAPNVDASLLLIPRVGFLPGTDPRVLGTIDAVQQRLTVDGLVRRYDVDGTDDGLPGGEGVFLACSFWLVDALHGAGRTDEATRLFERLLGLRNDVGLLSEQWDPRSSRQLGNTPQAFSHFALVGSAVGLAHERPHRSDEPVNSSARRDG